MTIDPGLLGFGAGLLLVLLVARRAAAGLRIGLHAFAGDALLGVALAGAIVLALGVTVELGVLDVGAAALAGLYWASVARERPRLSAAGLALSALGAALTAAALVLLALVYQWWFGPLALLLATLGGLAVNALHPLVVHPGAPRLVPAAEFPPPNGEAPPAPTHPSGPQTPPPQAAIPPSQPLPAKVAIVCSSCGLRGQVAAQGPPTLKCPRCGAAVPRTTASPPRGGVAGGRTPPPLRRGPSS